MQNFFDDRFQYFMNDAGHRLATLGSLGLMPRFFGNDLSKMFKQRYYGDLTLVPKFTTAHKCKWIDAKLLVISE